MIDTASGLTGMLSTLPATVAARLFYTTAWKADAPFAGALIEGEPERIRTVNLKITDLPGPLVLVQAASSEELARNPDAYSLQWLLEEVSTSVNTAAAGGNASLMSIG